MEYNDEDYELTSDTETDILINDFPLDLIKENLRYQISNPLSTEVDYLENIIDRYRILKEQLSENPEYMTQLNSHTIDFFLFIIKEIDSEFDLSVNIDMLDNIMDCMEVGTALYHFMVLRYRKNISRFIQKFIIKNKKSIVSIFDTEERRRDVSSMAIKKKIKNKDDALILSCLPNIIPYILSLDVEPADFISYAAPEDNYDAAIIRRMVLEGNMLGSFVQNYVGIISERYDHILDEIQTDIKIKLMNKN